MSIGLGERRHCLKSTPSDGSSQQIGTVHRETAAW